MKKLFHRYSSYKILLRLRAGAPAGARTPDTRLMVLLNGAAPFIIAGQARKGGALPTELLAHMARIEGLEPS